MRERIEHDALGEVRVPGNHAWGAQTQRSLEHFNIGPQMPGEILQALVLLKKAAALANEKAGVLDPLQARLICEVCDEIGQGEYPDEFPLCVYQTGSGTQTNMNVNEVIAHLVNERAGEALVHPNDTVNRSQSTNDMFPSAIHVAAVTTLIRDLLPAVDQLTVSFGMLEACYGDVIKLGRTHLQDAVPMTLGQEIGGWRAVCEEDAAFLRTTLDGLRRLAVGGTAVGTGLNAPKNFDQMVCDELNRETGLGFSPAPDKFAALSSKNALVFAHGALKTLAADLYKIANDLRLLSSGPRCGIGELELPANEPGSSIMPGKVNPTQCEALMMVCLRVMGNDASMGFAAASGNLQLNVCMPLFAEEFLESVRLLTQSLTSFDALCVRDLTPNRARIREHLERSLMLVTCLTPRIGYENAARAARYAHEQGCTLREAVLTLDLLSPEEFDELCRPERMI